MTYIRYQCGGGRHNFVSSSSLRLAAGANLQLFNGFLTDSLWVRGVEWDDAHLMTISRSLKPGSALRNSIPVFRDTVCLQQAGHGRTFAHED
jgi:hypothetical protein